MSDSNAELEAQVARLKEQISMTVHQLRTPLSAIKWTFHMIRNGELGPITSDQRSFLEKGYESTEKVISVVNNWLDLDYLEANKKKYQFIPADICELIEGVAFEFYPRIKEKNLVLAVERPKTNLPLVEVDPIKFSMIMENLLDNAVKYTSHGGKITVMINGDKVNDREPVVEIAVADTGIGIPEAEQERLFQQFFRSSNAAAISSRGSGLGLFIVKTLVEGHGGVVRFESTEGKGTTFFITIPLKQKKV